MPQPVPEDPMQAVHKLREAGILFWNQVESLALGSEHRPEIAIEVVRLAEIAFPGRLQNTMASNPS